MKIDKETIWHFTCDKCLAWFSIASSDKFNPKTRQFFCPWCGEKSACKEKNGLQTDQKVV